MKGSVRKRGEKWSYYFTYKQDGKYKKKEKGGFATKREAETALIEALHLYDKNNIIKQFNSYTLYDYINYWLENEATRTLKTRSIQIYRQATERHIKENIGYIKLTEINTVILYKFLSDKQQHYSASTVGTIRNVLNNTFNLAIRSGIIPFNPLREVKLNPKAYNNEKEQEKRALSKDEINTLLKLSNNTKFYLPILISLQMGLRRSEVLGLTWNNIDFSNRTMTIEKILISKKEGEVLLTPPKTQSSKRTIKMTNDVITLLQTEKHHQEQMKQTYGDYYYQKEDFVYCRENGTPFSPNNSFTPLFRDFIKEKIPFNLRFHDLRHTHATLLLEAGVVPKVIQQRLGHTNINTTLNVYSHITKEMEDISLERFENILK